ncbi:hypothetical protein MTR67_051667 [Solanum verrucosum]|nr:hypothetical protein MTR67_051667 [Solanum verrucosum]
MIWSWRR